MSDGDIEAILAEEDDTDLPAADLKSALEDDDDVSIFLGLISPRSSEDRL